jgi:hypothetical protein
MPSLYLSPERLLRQLRRLRELFPDRPIAAFTASAAQRERHDILFEPGLRDLHRDIASFHRPNLNYHVRMCDGNTQERLLRAVIHLALPKSIETPKWERCYGCAGPLDWMSAPAPAVRRAVSAAADSQLMQHMRESRLRAPAGHAGLHDLPSKPGRSVSQGTTDLRRSPVSYRDR